MLPNQARYQLRYTRMRHTRNMGIIRRRRGNVKSQVLGFGEIFMLQA